MTDPQALVALVPTLAGRPTPRGLHAVTAGPVTALLSPPPRRLPATRRQAALEALTRQRDLEAAMDLGPVLAAAPGTLVSPDAVAEVVAANRCAITDALDALVDRVQYQIVLGWDEAAVLTRFRDAPELRSALTPPVRPAALEAGIVRLARRLSGLAQSRLMAVGEDAIALPVAAGDLLNLALLVRSGAASALDAALEDVDALWTEGLRLRALGPGPAVCFALARLDWVAPDTVAEARRLLALGDADDVDAVAAARKSALRSGVRPAEVEAAANLVLRAAALSPERPVPVLTIARDGPSAVAPQSVPAVA